MKERLTIDEILKFYDKEIKEFEESNTEQELENGPLNFYYGRYWRARQVKEYLKELLEIRND